MPDGTYGGVRGGLIFTYSIMSEDGCVLYGRENVSAMAICLNM